MRESPGLCHTAGHAPPEVEHLPGGATVIRCPRCKKAVIERGMTDHPENKGLAPELSSDSK